jgi:release factor glutamine methyltransferase
MNLAEWQADLLRCLAPHSEIPRLDAQVLLAEILGRPRSWVAAHPEASPDPDQARRLQAARRRLAEGEPLPYVLGRQEFFGLNFQVNPDVLIPRPETEHLVERALDWLRAHPGRRLAADIGAGSGCIAVSLAAHVPDLQVLACDRSAAALHTARRNAAAHRVAGRIAFIQADLLPAVHARLDLVCANLPYIPSRLLAGLPVYGREPTLALDGGPDGLSLIRRLLARLSGLPYRPGLVLLEIEASQGPAALALASSEFPPARAAVLPDLAGRDRLLALEFPD